MAENVNKRCFRYTDNLVVPQCALHALFQGLYGILQVGGLYQVCLCDSVGKASGMK